MTLPVNVVFAVLVAWTLVTCGDGSPSVKLAVEKWHTFKIPTTGGTPSVKIESIVLEGEEDEQKEQETKGRKQEKYTEDVSLYCGANCLEGSPAENVTIKETEESLAFESVYPNGTRTLTRLRVQEQMVDYINAWVNDVRTREREATAGGARVRRKRAVFGFDTRFEVNVMKYITMYPFSAAVKLSTGCTGVLIAPQHVLTAAHCLHNGKRYIVNFKEVRVGFRRDREPTPGEDISPAEAFERSFIWIRAEKAYLPYDWTKKKTSLLPLDKDYAVILLKRSPEREHLEVGIGDMGSVPTGTMIHFTSFDIADEPKLFYRFCTVTGGTQELFYQQCDGELSSIGAGMYIRQWDPQAAGWSRRVIGLFGGYTSFINAAGILEEQNVAMRITPLKFAQICFWVTGDYSECKG